MNMLLWSDDVCDARFDSLFERLAALGFDGIEVPIFALDPARYVALGARLRALGLEPLALTARGPSANPIAAEPAVRERGARENRLAVECAAALGAEILCGPFLASPCVFTGAPPSEQERTWAVEALRELAQAADARGITLAVESLNHFEHHLANTAQQTAALCRGADHPRARMTYDTFHAHMEEKDVRAAILGCADVLEYVHVSENDRSTPGQGQVAWDATFAALREVGYDGWLTIEALGNVHPQLAADMKIWRRTFESEERLAREGLAFVREAWGQSSPATPANARSSRGMSGPIGP
jgi:D-psicose/D-tagatose/L-ribulose 3-epimerase